MRIVPAYVPGAMLVCAAARLPLKITYSVSVPLGAPSVSWLAVVLAGTQLVKELTIVAAVAPTPHV